MARMQVNVTVSLPSGTCCTVALAPDSRVQQLQPAIERSLKVPSCVQRFLAGSGDSSKEILAHQTLREVGLDRGGSVTLLRAWPEDDDSVVASIERVLSVKSNHNAMVATAVAELLDRDSPAVLIAAAQGLSWMGVAGTEHVGKIANLLTRQIKEPVKYVAAEALSWMGAPGAAYANAIACWGSAGLMKQNKTKMILRDMFWSEDRMVAQTALNSFAHGCGAYSPVIVARNIAEFFEEACFDSDCSVRQAASNALTELLRRMDWVAMDFAELAMIQRLCHFGATMLKCKSCTCSAAELEQALAPLVAAISSAANGNAFPVQAETKSAKIVLYQVRVVTIGLIARVFDAVGEHNGKYNLLSFVSSDCVQNKSAQVRIASVRWLIAQPRGVGAAMSVGRLKRNDRKKEVLAVVDAYFDAYADTVDLSSTGAVNTSVPQFSTGLQEDPDDEEFFEAFRNGFSDEAEEWEEDVDKHGRACRENKGSHGGSLQKSSTDKNKLRKAAEWKEASAAADNAYQQNTKDRDRRRVGNRDIKTADVGRFLLSSSLG